MFTSLLMLFTIIAVFLCFFIFIFKGAWSIYKYYKTINSPNRWDYPNVIYEKYDLENIQDSISDTIVMLSACLISAALFVRDTKTTILFAVFLVLSIYFNFKLKQEIKKYPSA